MIIKTKSFQMASNIHGDINASKVAILMPGRLDSKDYINFTSHAEFLADRELLAVAIDPPGTWESPGNLNDYTTSTYIKAISELIDYLGNRPTLLLGHSRGGATAMLASGNPAVAGLAVVNAAYGEPTPPNSEKIVHGALVEYRDLPPGDIRSKEQKRFDLPLAYFEDGKKHNPSAALIKFKGPKLLVHAVNDEFTEIGQVKEIYTKLSDPKMFLTIF